MTFSLCLTDAKGKQRVLQRAACTKALTLEDGIYPGQGEKHNVSGGRENKNANT